MTRFDRRGSGVAGIDIAPQEFSGVYRERPKEPFAGTSNSGGAKRRSDLPPSIIGDLAQVILQHFVSRCATCGCVLRHIKKAADSGDYQEYEFAERRPSVTSDFTPEQRSTLGMCWSTIETLLEFCESIQSKLNEGDAFLARMHADQLKIIRRRLLSSFPELPVWLSENRSTT